MANVGQKVRDLREAKGITQEDLAQRAGVRTATVSRIENGQTKAPYYQTMRGIAAALGVPFTQLWGAA